jgi:methylated-DNA-protein-cysteine methyltransferase-like protein
MADFAEDVYALVRAVPPGRVTSYGAVAEALGKPKGARQVGWVLNKSFSVLPPVPAHRVVNRLGHLSGAAHFPPDRPMAAQLADEGVVTKDGRIVDFEALFWDPVTELCE